jgi:hypothetical protein
MNFASASLGPTIWIVEDRLDIPTPNQKPEQVINIGEFLRSPRRHESIEKSLRCCHLESLSMLLK